MRSFVDKEKILPVSILAEGSVLPNGIFLTRTDAQIQYPPKAQQYIDEAWKQRGLQYPERPLVDSLVTIVRGINEVDKCWEIVTAPSTYKYRNGTSAPEFRELFGDELVAKTIGVDALVSTPDGYLLVGQRNTPRLGKTGGLHIAGGVIREEELITGLARELDEETGIKNGEFKIGSVLGVTQSKETLGFDVIYFCTSLLTKEEITQRQTDGELGRIFFPDTSNDLRRVLLDFLDTASTPVIAALYLYGKQSFGLNWVGLVLEDAERKISDYNNLNSSEKETRMNSIAARLSAMSV